mmetsp:Transcript_9046/g.8042  ORF Transcript_9046/g.8042 Transcript_9046/m.8042 type:complete len:89 (+) Transcript_9046:20-286(+)
MLERQQTTELAHQDPLEECKEEYKEESKEGHFLNKKLKLRKLKLQERLKDNSRTQENFETMSKNPESKNEIMTTNPIVPFDKIRKKMN